MNTAATRNDWVGRIIDGRFPLLEWLGGSEQGVVFRTQMEGAQPQRAAIRLIPVSNDEVNSRLDLWKRITQLSHPHLMRLLGAGHVRMDDDDFLYAVTEFSEESLDQVIPERPLTVGEVREMLPPILDALQYLHSQGFVYGRLKPSNVMVVHDQLKLPVEHICRAGFVRPRTQLRVYDAPELATGVLSPVADSWSLGITLVEALTQHPPLWDRSARQEPVVPAEVPQPFAGMARACLVFDSAKRSSIRDAKMALDPASARPEPANEIDLLAPLAVAAPDEEERRPPSAVRRMPLYIAGAVILVLIVIFLLERSHAPQSPVSAPPSTASPAVPSPAPLPPLSPSNAGTVRGAVVSRVMPDTSAEANRTIRGKVDVKVRVNVDAAGGVANATLESPGHSRYYAAKALDAARMWKFKPAQANGRAVPSVWTLSFEFRRSGADVTAESE